MAVTEIGNALREGVEAGIQAANQQLYQGSEQVIEATRSAGQEASQQFQGWAGTTGARFNRWSTACCRHVANERQPLVR